MRIAQQDGVDQDRVARGRRFTFAAPEPVGDGADDRLERQPVVLVQLGGEPHLGIDDAIVGQVERRLGSDAFDVGLGLHDGQRVLERGQVLQQVLAVGARREPGLQRVGIGLGQRPTDLVGQLEHGRHPQPTVEMVVQQRLGDRQAMSMSVSGVHGRQRTQRVAARCSRHDPSALRRSGTVCRRGPAF